MPTYEYFCEKKHGLFEEFHSIMTKLEFCPYCEQEGNQEPVNRLISGGVDKGIVKLYGDDLVSKTKEDAKKLEKDASRSDKLYGNLLGEDRMHKMQTQFDRRKR